MEKVTQNALGCLAKYVALIPSFSVSGTYDIHQKKKEKTDIRFPSNEERESEADHGKKFLSK